jgi:hypothetical protein
MVEYMDHLVRKINSSRPDGSYLFPLRLTSIKKLPRPITYRPVPSSRPVLGLSQVLRIYPTITSSDN